MPDLAALTADDFEPLIGEAIRRPLPDGGAVELVLTSVDRRRPTPEGREAFSLLLRGPLDPVLEPDVHPLRHPALGELEVFVGPVATGATDRVDYEVVFA